MHEIRLKPYDLAVDAFHPLAREEEKRGTVRGHAETDDECVPAYSDCAACLEGCSR